MSTKYTLGFMFDPAARTVVLIRKNKPAWQRGLLNGVGGKVEFGETPIAAIVREFQEETGVLTKQADWREFALLRGKGFVVACYITISNRLAQCESRTSEPIVLFDLDKDFRCRDAKMVNNLLWLIPLAWDSRHGDLFTTVEYHNEPL